MTDDQELVDDPFVPGRKCSPAMAKVHPSVRFEEAVTRHYGRQDELAQQRAVDRQDGGT